MDDSPQIDPVPDSRIVERVRNVTVNIAALIRLLSDALYMRYDTCVREYVANAHDACLRAEVAKPKVEIGVKSGVLSITDNGIGMTEATIHGNFVRISRSKEESFSRPEAAIGAFGIGMLSGFKVAERIVAYTKHEGDALGWRVEWERGQAFYRLAPWRDSGEPGTRIELHLDAANRRLFQLRGLKKAVVRDFSLLPMPVRVGGGRPVNQWHDRLEQEARTPGGRILKGSWARELIELVSECPDRLEAVYAWFAPDDHEDERLRGCRIFLGIPAVAREAARKHQMVSLFAKGVRVPSLPEEFLPKNLDFLIAVVDYPQIQIRLSRNEFVQDEGFEAVRDRVYDCAIDALAALRAGSRPMLRRVLAAHHVPLLSLARKEEAILELIATEYEFRTDKGNVMTWPRALEVLVRELRGERVLPVEVEVEDAGGDAPHESLLLSLEEKKVVERLADRAGVQLGVMDQRAAMDLPSQFGELRRRLFGNLRSRGISNLQFFIDARSDASPARFKARVSGQSDSVVGISVEALELNAEHRLVRGLAAKTDRLDASRSKAAAEVLFAMAALRSPLDNARIEGIEIMIGRAAQWLLHDVDSGLPGREPASGSRCFVAMPFADEFLTVWGGVQDVLRAAPYRWDVRRADEQHVKMQLLDNILSQIHECHRFVADLSGFNNNVLLEMGAMLGQNAATTLVLCDESTYQSLPANFRGMLVAVYRSELRESRQAFGKWLRKEVVKYPTFTS